MEAEFIAYVYPGWHESPWRPALDEWRLLDSFKPYFEDHAPPPKPLSGPYDDSQASTARRQVNLAREAGIRGFTYFLYYGPDGFLLDEPLAQALDAADGSDFEIGATWCLRLPHHVLPLPVHTDRQDLSRAQTAVLGEGGPGPSVGELAAVLPAGDLDELRLRTIVPLP